MKLNLKKTVLAAALTLAVVGQANAQVVTGALNAPGSNMFLSIWDTTTATSYTRDLGINASSFFAEVSGTNTALTANSSLVGSQLFVADALLTSFLSTVNMATTVWNVTGVDQQGTTAFGQKQLLTTSNTNLKSAANSLAASQLNGTNLTSIGNTDLYYTSLNQNGIGAATSMTAGAADSWYAGDATFGAKLSGTTFVGDTTTAIGSTLNFWYLTPSSTSAIAKASVAQFGNTAGVSTWTLASNGTLNYNVAAVPEPGEWALMLSGFGLIGFIASRRRNQSGNVTFA